MIFEVALLLPFRYHSRPKTYKPVRSTPCGDALPCRSFPWLFFPTPFGERLHWGSWACWRLLSFEMSLRLRPHSWAQMSFTIIVRKLTLLPWEISSRFLISIALFLLISFSRSSRLTMGTYLGSETSSHAFWEQWSFPWTLGVLLPGNQTQKSGSGRWQVSWRIALGF